MKYICTVCGWTTEADVQPAKCPICGATTFTAQEAGGEKGMKKHPEMIYRARELRKNMTPEERKLRRLKESWKF